MGLATEIDEKRGLGDAAYYEQWYRDRSPAWYRGILAEVLQYGEPGSVLDLGCGTGLLVELASQWGIETFGLDGSEAAIAGALKRSPQLPVRHAHFSEGLPLVSESFDNAVLHQVIEHLPAKTLTLVLDECRRVLKPRGTVFVFSPSRANQKEVARDPTHCNPQLPSELCQLLSSAGFEVFLQPNAPRFLANWTSLRWPMGALLNSPIQDWLSATANAYARRR